MTEEAERVCFVIAPIGEPQSETRRRSDQTLRHIIAPAVEAKGYATIRADQISEPGIITSQIIQHTVNDALVIADLTDRNPNVFYELALRHAVCRPFIQVARCGEQLPFDVVGTRTIFFDLHDPDSIDEAKSNIVDQITTLESSSFTLETPVSASLLPQRFRELTKELLNVAPRQGGRHRVDPSHIVSLVTATVTGDEYVETMPILLAAMRDDAPWVYDLGMDGYRQLVTGQRREASASFSRLLELMSLTAGIVTNPEIQVLFRLLREVLMSVGGRR